MSGPGTDRSAQPREQRLPPQAVEAERAVLGAMMLGDDAIGQVVEVLDETFAVCPLCNTTCGLGTESAPKPRIVDLISKAL